MVNVLNGFLVNKSVYFEKQLYTVHQLPSPCTIGVSKELIFLIKDLFYARNNPLIYWHFRFFCFGIWRVSFD